MLGKIYREKIQIIHSVWGCTQRNQTLLLGLCSIMSITIHFQTPACQRVLAISYNKRPSLQRKTSECWRAEICVYLRHLPSVYHTSMEEGKPMHNGAHACARGRPTWQSHLLNTNWCTSEHMLCHLIHHEGELSDSGRMSMRIYHHQTHAGDKTSLGSVYMRTSSRREWNKEWQVSILNPQCSGG